MMPPRWLLPRALGRGEHDRARRTGPAEPCIGESWAAPQNEPRGEPYGETDGEDTADEVPDAVRAAGA